MTQSRTQFLARRYKYYIDKISYFNRHKNFVSDELIKLIKEEQKATGADLQGLMQKYLGNLWILLEADMYSFNESQPTTATEAMLRLETLKGANGHVRQ